MIETSKGLTMVILVFLTAATFLPLVDLSQAERIEGSVELIFEVPDPEIISEEGKVMLIVDGWGSSSVAGEPVLPERTFYLPIGDSVPELRSVEVDGANTMRIEGELFAVPYPAVYDNIAYDTNNTVIDTLKVSGTIDVKGSNYLMIRLSPYLIENGYLSYPDRILVSLDTGYQTTVSSVVVDNDLPDPTVEDVDGSVPLWENAVLPSNEFSPGAVYYNQKPPVECLIITSSTLNSSLQSLSDWKTRRGVYTEVIETSYIYSNWNGIDNQEKIRNCIKDHYINESLEWVILGGDHSVVPSRMAYVPDGYGDSGSDGSTVPADAYYGDISGSGHTPYDWDGDNDGNFGEYSVDGIDLSLEVYVGRLSATSTSAMSSLVSDILNYEKNPPSGGWYNRSVLAGAYSNYVTSTSPATDEAKLKEAIRKDYMDNGNYINYTLYEGGGIAPSSYPKNASLTTSNLVNAISSGAFMVNLAGHGSNTGIYRRIWNSDSNSNGYCDSGEYSDTSYYSTSSSPSNGGKKPLFYNDACNNGNFDLTFCLTEDILRDVGIGAVGSARVSWYAVGWSKGSDGGWYNQGHDYRFWEQFFNGAYQPGKALALSHSDYISDKGAHDKYSWKNLLQYNLMGDPEIPIWNQTPANFNVTYSDPIPTPGNYQFTVKDASGNPVQGAVVCLTNGTTFWAEALTDSQGKATLNMPSLTMQMNLTVTKRNFKPFEKTVNVGKDNQPPRMGMMAMDGQWSTGDDYSITAYVTDNVGVTNVTIRFGWNNSIPTNPFNYSMINNGSSWFIHGTHPSNSLDPFWFSVGAADAVGQWNHTGWTRKNITDNDKPRFLMDNTSFGATTGDPLLVECKISDNIRTSDVFFEYTYDDSTWHSILMNGTGTERDFVLNIPDDDDGFVRYHFNLTDTSGNFNVTGNFYRDILDNDRPIFLEDLTELPPTTGNTTKFHIRAVDNIDLFQVRLVYREQGQPERNFSMSSTDDENYTYSMVMPSDRISSISYHFYLVDTAGNQVRTDTVDSRITDDDLPSITGMTLPSQMTTGDRHLFVISASDNIMVHSVKARIILPGGESIVVNGSLNPSNGNWEIDPEMPASVVGNASVTITIEDAAGNSYLSDPVSIPVVDNDRPSVISDITPSEINCLDRFRYEVQVHDNIGIREIRLFRSGRSSFDIMSWQTRSYTYYFDSTAPGKAGPVSYHLEIEDLSGNVLETGEVFITVVDDLEPELSVCGFLPVNLSGELLTRVTTGEDFTLVAAVNENDQLESVGVEIRFPGNDTIIELNMNSDILDLTPRDPFNYSVDIPMPDDVKGMVEYRIVGTDESGNNMTSEWFTIDLYDNDNPELYLDQGDLEIGTGERKNYVFVAGDNVGIENSDVWIPDHPGAQLEHYINGKYLIVELLMDESFPSSKPVLHVTVSDGNNSVESTVVLTLLDKTPPKLVFVERPEDIVPGETYDLRVTITDNVGWSDPQARWFKVTTDMTIESQEITLDPIVGLGVEGEIEAPGTGRWVLNFSVVDDNGNMADREFVYEIADNEKPVADLKVNISTVESGQVIDLDASGTTDDSNIVEYKWTITKPDGSKDVHTGEFFQYEPEEAGEYTVELEVVDEFGNRARASTTISVTPIDDEEDDNPFDGMIIYFVIVGSVLLLLIVLVAVFLAIRKGKGKEEEYSFDEEDMEEAETWDV